MRHARLVMPVIAIIVAGSGLASGEETVLKGPILPASNVIEVRDTVVILADATPSDAVQDDGAIILASCKNCGSHECGGHHQMVNVCNSCRQAPCACGVQAHATCSSCRQTRRGAAASFNCCCQGSYKFPVPRQYTYHWPGMYSQQQMITYPSPYRFPPLELPPGFRPLPGKPQLAADGDRRPGFERTSEKLKRMQALK